ncbi:MAG TPA: serine protease [Candidatus Sulfomarinibacteraceae bacterium]|nr:serine protease [Candidatus Sulfomarinibacteraceae bacterium]
MRGMILRQLFLGVVIALAAAAPWAAEPLQVGEAYPITIDSTGRTGLASKLTATGRVWEVHHPDATYIALHFSSFAPAPGDRVFVSDPKSGQRVLVGDRSTAEDSSFWSRHVKGDTLVLEYISTTLAPTSRIAAFTVDEYAAGYVDLGGEPEVICGADDYENAVCYSGSDEYQHARAVARLLIRSRWLCTGWLVSEDNLLVTNEHCITSERDALNTDYEFALEAPECDSPNSSSLWSGVVYDGLQFIRDNPALDYALIRLDGNPAAVYGWLEIDGRIPEPGDLMYMPQHPAGRAKEFGIIDSSYGPGAFCRIASVDAPACTGATDYSDFSYSCDTEGGSSGSPVISRLSHKVIALHHCGYTCSNTGVPIHLIYDEIAQYLPPPIDECGNGTCLPPEDSCNCPDDCGTPPSFELVCDDGNDNDCDGFTDCDDMDCGEDPSCATSCGAPGDPCASASDCCSFKCVGKPGSRICK